MSQVNIEVKFHVQTGHDYAAISLSEFYTLWKSGVHDWQMLANVTQV